MRRSILRLILAFAAAALLPVTSGAQPQAVQSINGIGMVDYARKPDFKVGSWARYRLLAHSELGMKDDYTVTVLIGGEEAWWGEDCFWVETWTDVAGQAPKTEATLMSYAIFEDSLALPHMQLYMRKTVAGLEEDGTPHEDLYKRAQSSLKSRTPISDQIQWNVDTLGTDTVSTPRSSFTCRKVRIEQGTGATASVGDSSIYTEVRDRRTTYLSDHVPITHIVREDIETSMARKTWMVGKSNAATHLNTMDRSLGSARLEDFGEGLQARLVPVEKRKSLREQSAAAAHAPATPKPRAKARSLPKQPG